MKIKILNQQPIPNDQNIPHHVDMWYDRHLRSWVVQLMDVYGNQVTAEADYAYTKQEAISIKKLYEDNYKL
jgi:hypothetical protein